MAGLVILSAFAAFGAICAVWAVLGWLIPGLRGERVLVICTTPAALRHCCWLRDWGLLRGCVCFAGEPSPSRIIDFGKLRAEDTERITEQEETYGTGNGDHTGHHRCRGISEL